MAWMRLHEKLEWMRENGIRIIKYSELEAANEALVEPLSREQLELFVQFQHNCGYILHFNDPHLKHLVVLDPKLVIDATKCIVTCRPFVLNLWDKRKWDKMVTTGQIKESYIINVWKKRHEEVYQYKEYILNVLKRLDIVTTPKVYHEGAEANVDFLYVPCMLQGNTPEVPSQRRKESIEVAFNFNGVLPPAIYHRLVASCLALWPVQKGGLSNGMVVLKSGQHHKILIRRESCSIFVSVNHTTDASKIDLSLVRSLRRFIIQTLERIISVYSHVLGKDTEDVYAIEYNQNAVTRGIGEYDDKVILRIFDKCTCLQSPLRTQDYISCVWNLCSFDFNSFKNWIFSYTDML